MVHGTGDHKIIKSRSGVYPVQIKNQTDYFRSTICKGQVPCPYCGTVSSKVHSVYQREIQDIPLQDRQTILLLNTRKMFCMNPACGHKTFSERFDFIAPKERKTRRLVNKILKTSSKLSSVSASALLKEDSIKVCKSSICDLLKKNADSCG